MQKKIFILSLVLGFSITAFAQRDSTVYFKGAIKENRERLQRNIIRYTITRNLSLPLNDDSEENWMDAFGGMELLRYRSPWADGRINMAFDSIEKRSTGFQRALLELAYACYPDRFVKQVTSFINVSTDARVFAMSAEYLLLNNKIPVAGINLEKSKGQLVKNEKDEAIRRQLFYHLQHLDHKENCISITGMVGPDFLENHTLLYSFQRKNRNYPGLALIRDPAGNFIKDENGSIFSVPQLARSINNLPGYLTNGNTPQGIYRMYGFDTSKSNFIGPTTNIQLTMPFETSLRHFFSDSSITDSVWTEEWYKKLLPGIFKNCGPLFESFYAGKAGRTEIIAHGTTVDPGYYAGETYYPQTPTMGCLCTKEIWSDTDGRRLESDQQKLVSALQMAGGANGYCVVIEIDDAPKPVTIGDILPLLKQVTSQ
ncbi:MAG: hypothetical protein ABI760_18975 [Ferruginibacter sp.]